MKKRQDVEIAVIGMGIVGISTAYYLCKKYACKSVLLIDPRDPMSYTSVQSGDNFRNWWPSKAMTQFTNGRMNLICALGQKNARKNMSKTVDFIFDFGSPNAYLSYRVVKEICKRAGARLNIIPVLLGGIFKLTNNQSPLLAFRSVKGKVEYEQTELLRFVKKNSLTNFKNNSHFPVNTLTLMRGAIAGQGDGNLEKYIEVGLSAMWENDQKMDDPEVFVSVMDAAGFDGANLLTRTSDAQVKATLIANTQAAVDRGAFGIPTFFIGDEMYFGKERLGQVEEVLLS